MSTVKISMVADIPTGLHRLEYYAIDRAGNRSKTATITVTVDGRQFTIDGNRLIDTSGTEVRFYGVHISRPEIFNPSKALAFNNWRDIDKLLQKDLDEIKNILKANSVRLGISPAWMKYNTEGYGYRLDHYIDSAINMAMERGLYVLLDFHAVDSSVYPYTKGGITYGKKYSEDKTTYELMVEFWARYAPRYSRYPYTRYVIFELWNEEVRNAEVLDEWLDYKAKMEHVIKNVIRPVAPYNLLIVNGLNNGLNLRRVVESTDYRIDDPQNLIIYGWHPYPNSVKPTFSERETLTDYLSSASSSWTYNLKGPSNRGYPSITTQYPVVITEFGWRDPSVRTDLTETQKNEYGGRYIRSDGSPDYGKALLIYAHTQDIKGYFPFRFYYEKLAIVSSMPDWWGPTRTYSYTPDYGEVIRQWFSSTSRSIP